VSKEISKDRKDFINIPIDIETLESIARVKGCHYNNFDWWEVSQYIKDACLAKEKNISAYNVKKVH
jgi:hypothetical protein